MITPGQGSRIREEQDGATTPVLARRSSSRADADGMSTPASSPSELASILTASDDDSRPATKRELNLLRLNIRAMCTSLREYVADEFRQRDTVDTLMTALLTVLEAQTLFEQRRPC